MGNMENTRFIYSWSEIMKLGTGNKGFVINLVIGIDQLIIRKY
jgi:hypothetical protein